MSLKIYEWEHQQFKDLYDIRLLPQVQDKVVRALAKVFGVAINKLEFCTRYNGKAYTYKGIIQLPRIGCSVGLALHEIAHLYDWQKFNHRGHTGTFKKSLIKLMCESRYELPKVLKAVHHEA